MRRFVWILLAVWLAAYAWSFASFFTVEPTGDGFTRGLNRVTQFFGWQIGAGLIAFIIWQLGRAFERGSAGRWLCRLPIALAAALFAATASLIAWANWAKPSPNTDYVPDEQRPVTAPAEPTVEPKPATEPEIDPEP